MVDINKVFGGDTLKAADLQGNEPVVTIENVEVKEFNEKNKLVISFVGKKKVLVANATNSKRIAFMYGPDTDKWIGAKIQLYTDIVDFQGKAVEAIRVRPVKQQPAKPAAKEVPFDDPIGIDETF